MRLILRCAALLLTGLAMLAAPAAWAARPLAIGERFSSDLGPGDPALTDGKYAETYRFAGRAGQRVTIRMRSSDFDAYLLIRGPADFAEDNDDAAPSDRDALLDVRLPATGTYRITATSYRRGSGRYTIELSSGGAMAMPPAATGRSNAIRPGQTVQGELARGDGRLPTGEYQDLWTFRARRGERYVARLTSGAFDPYLIVRGPGGLRGDNDDDPTMRGSRNARVEFTAAADGVIEIGATSYRPGEAGRYALTLETPAAPARPRPSAPPPPERTLTLGNPIEGRLDQGDGQMPTGELFDAYALAGRRGQRVELRLSAKEFDPFLKITGPGGFSVQNDDDPDGGGTRDSRITLTFPADGTYRVVVTSYQPGERGSYRLTASPGTIDSSAPVTVTSATPPGGASMTVGQSMAGTLGQGDRTLASGEYVDRYRFRGERGQRVEIDLTSSAFDAYLILQPPSGERRDNDDAPGDRTSTNSRIELALPEDGEYTVMVTSYRAGETGSYQFSIRPSLGNARMQAARPGERLFALMVGVSDYGGNGRGDLAYTAEDATKLAETLRRAGVLNPSSMTLTDAHATRAEFREAFQRVAAAAGPDDVFLFFYSGHGGQQPAPNSNVELDNRSETLVLRDGVITDEDLRGLLGSVHTRMALVVLDSCFSGGFARNVVSRPGVMGLFSSEEDLTSSVAEKFRAGGFLSHFVREGLAGAADADGDRIVTAGELAAYVRAEFAREASDVVAETSDGERNYQNLVVDRGGVQVDDAVLRLAAR